ncbi:MAG: Flp pilus assembly protein CpaB [Thermoflexales bacterium]|nr:Flp pilus assembly protein CpaB [Thermoflexales bacterium]
MEGRRRIFIIAGLVLLLGIVAIAVVLMMRGGGGGGEVVEIEPSPTPPQTVGIVVAVQTIERGRQIMSDTVGLYEWPVEQVPPGALYSVDEALGLYAMFDIPPGVPILTTIAVDTRSLVPSVPSDLPFKIPTGKVAIALPINRLSSIGYALNPGDRVDAMASFLVLDLDEEFQTKLQNNQTLAVPGKETITFMTIEPGGRNRNPLLGFAALEYPSEVQRPRLVAQLTVQNLMVLGVGDWITEPEPQPQPTPQGGSGQAQATPEGPTLPEIVTLVADPQDALALKFLREAGAIIDLALRSASDTEQTFTTESVTVQYIFARFDVAEPPKLPYGIEPGVYFYFDTEKLDTQD